MGAHGSLHPLVETFAQPSFRGSRNPERFDYAHPEPVEGPGWFDKLTMSGYAKVSLVGEG